MRDSQARPAGNDAHAGGNHSWRRRCPDHYSGIRSHPHNPAGWLWHVLCGGLLQAALLAILANTAATFLMAMLPLLLLLPDPLLFNYVTVAVGFMLGSAMAGHILPHYAFYRSGAAFLMATIIDFLRVNYCDQLGLFVPRDYRIIEVVPFGVLGAMVAALAASLGSRWRRGLGEWLEDEWREFLESVGVEMEDGEDGEDAQTATEGEDESAAHRRQASGNSSTTTE